MAVRHREINFIITGKHSPFIVVEDAKKLGKGELTSVVFFVCLFVLSIQQVKIKKTMDG